VSTSSVLLGPTTATMLPEGVTAGNWLSWTVLTGLIEVSLCSPDELGEGSSENSTELATGGSVT
jgi:hypothetical protein